MTYQKEKNRILESPTDTLVHTLKYLRVGEEDVEYHIRELQEQLKNGDMENIEAEILSAKPLNVDRVQGGTNTDSHDKMLKIIDRCERQISPVRNQLIGLMRLRAQYAALKRDIISLPLPYRWILTAKYIDGQKDTQIRARVNFGKTRYYQTVNEGLEILLRQINYKIPELSEPNELNEH